MHIILLNGRAGSTRTVRFNATSLLLGLMILVGASVSLGAYLGAKWTAITPQVDQSLAEQLDLQREQSQRLQQDAQRQLDAFAAHVADLQARLTRLDALGERLTELAELDEGEFDFSLNVGQGGAEDALGASVYAVAPFLDTLDVLSSRVENREQQLGVLEQLLGERRLLEEQTLAGHPVRSGYISSPFGTRVHPLTGRLSVHKGVDFAAKAGSEVVAVATGVVSFAGRRAGYGNVVELSHTDGYTTLYAHNQSNLVQIGDLVQRGQPIAKVGSSGRSTGHHVHFEVWKNGRVVNPATYIARSTVTE